MPRTSASRSYYLLDSSLIKFARELLTNGGNATHALNTVFPDPERKPNQSNQLAYRMRKSEIVQRMLSDATSRAMKVAEKAVNRYILDADSVANDLVRMGSTDLRQVVDWGTETDPETGLKTQFVRVKAPDEIDPDAHKALTEITRRADGSLTVKLADKRAALMDLARLKGWIQDKPETQAPAVQLIIQR